MQNYLSEATNNFLINCKKENCKIYMQCNSLASSAQYETTEMLVISYINMYHQWTDHFL